MTALTSTVVTVQAVGELLLQFDSSYDVSGNKHSVAVQCWFRRLPIISHVFPNGGRSIANAGSSGANPVPSEEYGLEIGTRRCANKNEPRQVAGKAI